MRLKKIHRAVSFHQSSWLKTYVDFNSEKRKESKTAFEKSFFKLMVNSFFGKSCENVRKYKDIKLVTSEDRQRKLTSKPDFHSFKIFHSHLSAIQLNRGTVKLFKPRYVGLAILEISKILMYNMHYNVMKTRYPEGCRLLLTDTDSFVYHIQTDDLYADLRNDDNFDFSNYSQEHANFNTSNKMVVGKMKDETAGIPIQEFVGLRSKMYSFVYGDHCEKKIAKGIKRYVTENQMTMADFKTCLFSEEKKTHSMYSIRHMLHVLYTTRNTKISLSPYDDKRYLLDTLSSFSYGHYGIDSMIQEEMIESPAKQARHF